MEYSYGLMRKYAETMAAYLRSFPENAPEAIQQTHLYQVFKNDLGLLRKMDAWMLPEIILQRFHLYGPWPSFKILSTLADERQRNTSLENRAA